MTDQPAQGSTADYCSAWPSDVPERNNHHLITHMRGGALASVQRCQFCGWIDFADLDEQVRAQADAAYERGLTEGRRQADTEAFADQWAACPSCRTSGAAVGACEDRWHLDNLVGGPNRRFNAAVRELAGLFGARKGGKTTAARIVKEVYEAGEADGRRQATEGWERRWAYGTPADVMIPLRDAEDAQSYQKWIAQQRALGLPAGVVHARLVGPWEPADPKGSSE